MGSTENESNSSQSKNLHENSKENVESASCPNCGSSDYIPILYGYPSPDAFEKEERGELILAGCVIFESNPPRKQCKSCGKKYN